ncbi:uncharacterized protein LOC6561633 [Drosophila grimshawi]|uniref:GH11105 n=1 Tax=Drosophila grimshawi TaxID=7222 RepID=B4JCV5_DROGR|nr:uncharacterized protein LOC6561633 [Drosophila grimshawi]EDW03194.1 GH11105 [Drosophila grimshawi]
MNTQLIVLIVCLAGLLVSAQEEVVVQSQAEARRPVDLNHLSTAQILRHLVENSETLQQIDSKTLGVSNSQKGIEQKLSLLGQDVAEIARLEDNLKKLVPCIAGKSQLTDNNIKTLTSSLHDAENRTVRAIDTLSRGQLDIKQGLTKADQNQKRHDLNLDQLGKSVHQRLNGLDNLVKQMVLKELVTLGQASKKLEQGQKLIESKVVHLDELAALSSITANKVYQLEQGLRSINSTQQYQLAAIGQNMQQLGATTWQIDNKLGVLLSTQKNIERAVVECKKCQPQHMDRNPHEHWQQPQFPQVYEHKDAQKTPVKTEYETSYANADEASYLYQLWYGKDDK